MLDLLWHDGQKEFNSGLLYDNRYREYSSPRVYGRDPTLHLSESLASIAPTF
jgi:hypothetical protein